MTTKPVLSRPVDIAAIPAPGLVRDVVATDAEREAVAAAYDLLSVAGLSAEFTVSRQPGGVIAVEGRVQAKIAQPCVVSLVPVEQEIDEPMSLRFVTNPAAVHPEHQFVEAGNTEPPELLEGSTIDLGAIAEEHFVLAIDPYPRAPGAVLPSGSETPDSGEGDSPFAVLRGLGDKLKSR